MLAAYLFFAVPIISFIFFAGCLISFIAAKNKNKRDPDSYSDAEMKNKRNLLTISSVIFGFFATVIIVLIALLYTAVAYM